MVIANTGAGAGAGVSMPRRTTRRNTYAPKQSGAGHVQCRQLHNTGAAISDPIISPPLFRNYTCANYISCACCWLPIPAAPRFNFTQRPKESNGVRQTPSGSPKKDANTALPGGGDGAGALLVVDERARTAGPYMLLQVLGSGSEGVVHAAAVPHSHAARADHQANSGGGGGGGGGGDMSRHVEPTTFRHFFSGVASMT